MTGRQHPPAPKMLAMPTGEHGLARRVNVLGRCYLTGQFSDVHDWPVLGVHRGRSLWKEADAANRYPGPLWLSPLGIDVVRRDRFARSWQVGFVSAVCG